MQVFEFHFSPSPKSALKKEGLDLMFDSFVYEPVNISEKKLGGLYMAGILKNVFPQNINFLDNLAKVIKERYYRTVLTGSEKNLKDALKKANEHLEMISKNGDVSWLGNLGFVAMAVSKSNLYFTKVGETKVYLLRGGQIVDIDHRLDTEDIEPYPLKVFGNIVSGKLSENDIILILTKDVADVFLKEKILSKISRLSLLPSSGNLFKALKEIFSLKKEQILKTAGVCLLVSCAEKPFLKQKEILAQSKNLKNFSLGEAFPLIASAIPAISQSIKKIKTDFSERTVKLLALLNFRNSKTANIAKKNKAKKKGEDKKRPLLFPPQLGWPKLSFSNKNVVLVLFLILFVSFGYLVFQKKNEDQLKIYQKNFSKIEEKVNLAETYLAVSGDNLQSQKKANSLLLESWNQLSPLSGIAATLSPSFSIRVNALKEKVLERLYQINRMEIIKDPSLFVEIKTKDFVPQKLIFFQDNLYVFNSYAKNLFEVNQKGEGRILNLDKKIDFAYAEKNSLLLFSKPNEITVFKNGQFQSPISLESPSADFNFTSFASYLFNLYFTQGNEIIKYPSLKEDRWAEPQSWLNPKIKIATDFRSITTDGSIWILTKENTIKKYYLGNLEKTLTLETFPEPQGLMKMLAFSQLSYLYFLEPGQRRIIVADKSGNVIKQFQSDKFDNLLDFAVSINGKSVYILNGLKIYRISM